MKITQEKLAEYLSRRFNGDVKINEFRVLGKGVYGTAYLVDFDVNNQNRRLVLKTMALGGFGHDHFSDVAGILIWEHSVYEKLPKHIKSFDVIGLEDGGELVSIGRAKEYYILLEEALGKEYNFDLDRIMKTGITELDRKRIVALATYLADIHSKKLNKPELYVRRARDLIGHGEYILGVLDGYPEHSFASQREINDIVKNCVDWWSILKKKTHRLSQVHGDFHPFNIMFKDNSGTDFTVLDRSRGEFGEPADDVSGLAINFIFWSLVKYKKFKGEFKELFDLFFKTYLEETKDYEILEVIAPFFTFRGVVLANPVFYPKEWFEKQGYKGDPDDLRRKLFNFAKVVLREDKFDLNKINEYLGE